MAGIYIVLLISYFPNDFDKSEEGKTWVDMVRGNGGMQKKLPVVS